MVRRALERVRNPPLVIPLEEWDEADVDRVVSAFVDEKFPTVVALNKIDHADSDQNVARIAKLLPDPSAMVLCSAVAEVFLRKLARQRYVRYREGGDEVETREDLVAAGDETGGGLREMDDKNRNRVENLRDMVLYRFGSTGVAQALRRAADLLGLVPVFPVRNTTTFGSSGGGAAEAKHVFRDCVLVKRGTTVGEVARKVMGDAPVAFVEGVGGLRVAEDDVVAVGKNDVRLPCRAPSSAFLPSPLCCRLQRADTHALVVDIIFQSRSVVTAAKAWRLRLRVGMGHLGVGIPSEAMQRHALFVLPPYRP